MEEVTKIGELKSFSSIVQKLSDYYQQNIILKNVGSMIPLVDPTISAISEKFVQKESKRIEKFIELLIEKVNLLEKNMLDNEFIQTEEFARLVFKTLESVKKDYRKNKLECYANILTNYSTKEYSDTFSKESIIERISGYSEEHILTLYGFDYRYIDSSLKEDSKKTNPYQIDTKVKQVCIADLSSDGFLKEVTGSFLGYMGGSYYITSFGEQCIDLIMGNNLYKKPNEM